MQIKVLITENEFLTGDLLEESYEERVIGVRPIPERIIMK